MDIVAASNYKGLYDEYWLLKFINNNNINNYYLWKENKGKHYREGGLDVWS